MGVKVGYIGTLGYGVYADSNGVMYARQGTGLSFYTVADNGAASLLAVAKKEESKGLWVGWIDETYYDGLYPLTAGWYATDHHHPSLL